MKTLTTLPLLGLAISCVPCHFAFTVPLKYNGVLRSRISAPITAAASSSDECDLDEAGASDCLSLSGYIPKTASYLTVTEVYVAEIESLRGRFDSYDDENNKNNIIKFNKRRKRGTHAFANSTGSSSSNMFGGKKDSNSREAAQSGLQSDNTHVANLEYNELVGDDEIVLVDTVRKPGMQSISRAFPRAGPRKSLHFNPSKVNAAIVTCGGLCPGQLQQCVRTNQRMCEYCVFYTCFGVCTEIFVLTRSNSKTLALSGLNNVIRELVHSLYFLYGANSVYGIQGGFHGFHDPLYPPIHLTNDVSCRRCAISNYCSEVCGPF